LKTRWGDLRSGILSNQAILDKIDNYKSLLITSEAAEKNFVVWSVLDKYIWPNNYIGNTYTAEIDYLKNWIQERVLWLDVEIMNL
jgi:hypothetical protein